MSEARRFLSDVTGFTYEEITDFPDGCIRPERNNKKSILSGYFDLLYYEYREQLAIRYAALSGILVLVAVLFVVLHEYALATAIVLSLMGIANAILGHRQGKRFSSYRNAVERELRRLGVGIRHEQLTDSTVESTAWGKIQPYPVSGLGIVRPVSAKDFTVWGDRVYALANDNVYR